MTWHWLIVQIYPILSKYCLRCRLDYWCSDNVSNGLHNLAESSTRRSIPPSYQSSKYDITARTHLVWLTINTWSTGIELAWLCPNVKSSLVNTHDWFLSLSNAWLTWNSTFLKFRYKNCFVRFRAEYSVKLHLILFVPGKKNYLFSWFCSQANHSVLDLHPWFNVM